MNVVREIQKLNEKELQQGTAKEGSSWHDQYKDSAWVFVGGLPLELSEGDVLCVMSQWGEIEDVHLVRDKGSGKSKGFAFLKYEDQRSTVLAVDNFNGIKILERTIRYERELTHPPTHPPTFSHPSTHPPTHPLTHANRVDHKEKYSLPKDILDKEAEKEKEALEQGKVPEGGPLWKPGHAYEGKEIRGEHDLSKGVDLFAPKKEEGEEEEEDDSEGFVSSGEEGGGEEGSERKRRKEEKRRKKEAKKKLKKEKKKKRKREEEALEKLAGGRKKEEEEEEEEEERRRERDSSSRRGGRSRSRERGRGGGDRGGDRGGGDQGGDRGDRRRSRSHDRRPWERTEGERQTEEEATAPPLPPPPPDGQPSWRGRYDPHARQEGRGRGRGGGGFGGRGFDTGGAGERSMFGRGMGRGGGGRGGGGMTGIGGLNRRR